MLKYYFLLLLLAFHSIKSNKGNIIDLISNVLDRSNSQDIFKNVLDLNHFTKKNIIHLFTANNCSIQNQMCPTTEVTNKSSVFLGKRQIANNTINIFSDSIQGGTFIGKREIFKRKWIGNSAIIRASLIDTGNYIGKRTLNKRQWQQNIANITARTIIAGNFIGKRQVANILTNKIQNVKLNGRVNIVSNSFDGISVDCSKSGCVNKIG